MSEIDNLAGVLGDNQPSGDALRLRRGVVTAVNGAGFTATVTIGGTSVTGIPFYRHLSLTAGNVVDVLLDGPAPRVLGVL